MNEEQQKAYDKFTERAQNLFKAALAYMPDKLSFSIGSDNWDHSPETIQVHASRMAMDFVQSNLGPVLIDLINIHGGLRFWLERVLCKKGTGLPEYVCYIWQKGHFKVPDLEGRIKINLVTNIATSETIFDRQQQERDLRGKAVRELGCFDYDGGS